MRVMTLSDLSLIAVRAIAPQKAVPGFESPVAAKKTHLSSR
jgi:hypothetical protein